MKKLVLATLLAAATGAVSAQSVELSGFIREFITDTKTGTAASVKGLTSDAPTSITIKANEDLGGGLKARVTVQTAVAMDSPNTAADTQLGGLQSTVGLTNQLGSIDLGRQKHALRQTIDLVDPFLVGTFSTSAKVHNVQGSRTSNGVFTAVKVGPATVKYDRGFSEVAGTGATESTSAWVTAYGVTGGVAYFKDDSSSQNKSTLGVLSTTLPGVNTKVSGLYSRDESTTTSTNTDAWSVYAVQPVGQFDLKAAYGHKNVGDVTSYTVGVAYNLSKRTSLEAALLKVTATSAASESRVAGLGINHTF